MHKMLQMMNAGKRERERRSKVYLFKCKLSKMISVWLFRAWLWQDLKYYNQAGPNVLFTSAAWDVGAQLTSYLRNSIAIGFLISLQPEQHKSNWCHSALLSYSNFGATALLNVSSCVSQVHFEIRVAQFSTYSVPLRTIKMTANIIFSTLNLNYIYIYYIYSKVLNLCCVRVANMPVECSVSVWRMVGDGMLTMLGLRYGRNGSPGMGT